MLDNAVDAIITIDGRGSAFRFTVPLEPAAAPGDAEKLGEEELRALVAEFVEDAAAKAAIGGGEDPAATRVAVHDLKSTASTLGLVGLRRLAEAIEQACLERSAPACPTGWRRRSTRCTARFRKRRSWRTPGISSAAS